MLILPVAYCRYHDGGDAAGFRDDDDDDDHDSDVGLDCDGDDVMGAS